jgi:hypothetical protein
MHTVDLGVWVHLLTCIACKFDASLKKYHILKADKIAGIWDRLAERVELLDPDECMFRMNKYKGNFLKYSLQERQEVQSKSKQKVKKMKFEAWEHHLLMNVSDVCFAHDDVCSVQRPNCCVFFIRLFLFFSRTWSLRKSMKSTPS